MYKNILLLLATFVFTGCDGLNSTDSQQRRATEKMVSQANQEIGMPDIINWAERRNAKTILELRDQELTTYAYIVDMNGNLHFLGEAVGYGLPYSVQFTNPMKRIGDGIDGEIDTIPQPDPNGLFMPEGLSATWIMLRDPSTGNVRPVYVEPSIIVSPFPLDHKHSYQNEQ